MTKNTKNYFLTPSISGSVAGYRLEADGNGRYMKIFISGVRCVSSFSDSSVEVLTKKEKLNINGKLIEISVFENKTIEISGNIAEILINSKKERLEVDG